MGHITSGSNIVAGASLLTLLDDIATLLDDVSVMTKVAAKKTAGVLGDDLALNAEQVTGVRAERELPVVWAVFKGSAINKLILVPSALAISAVLPWLITPLLMIGGAFLCFEGFEKVAHRMLHPKSEDEAEQAARRKAVADEDVDMVAFEKRRIKGAIRTDAVLSAEIIVIALGTVQDATLAVRIGVVTSIAALMTIGVYGLVAGIVRLDDAGLYLLEEKASNAWGAFKRWLGQAILKLAPKLMKTLAVVGTAAMFLVGGGILVHGIPAAEHVLHALVEMLVGDNGFLGGLITMLLNGLFGGLAGGLLVGIGELIKLILPKKQAR